MTVKPWVTANGVDVYRASELLMEDTDLRFETIEGALALVTMHCFKTNTPFYSAPPGCTASIQEAVNMAKEGGADHVVIDDLY